MSTVPPQPAEAGGPPWIQWARLGLRPAAALYVQRDDKLYLAHRASVAVVVTVRVRLQQADDGRVVPQEFTFTTTADRSQQFDVFDLAEGFLLGATVFSTASGMAAGAIYAELGLVRGGAAIGARSHSLAAGYLDKSDALFWPGGGNRYARRGPGQLRSITGTNPAANTEISETVPTGAEWLLHSVRFALVTDANVANRDVHLLLDDGTTVLIDVPASAVQAASVTRNYTAAPYGALVTSAGLATELYMALPAGIRLGAGYRIRTSTTNLQAGDDYGAPQLLVEELLVA